MEITKELLRKLLDYNPETGVLTWKERERGMFSSNRGFSTWNARYANTQAFVNDCHGYLCGSIFRTKYLAHRIIWIWMTGEVPNEVDHINGNRADNRWSNLRNVNKSTNMKNAKMPKTNTSGRVGVYWYEPYGKWLAKISFKKGPKNLGYFEKFEDAVSAREEAEIKYGFHENHGRVE